jgi:hypothetical protein
LFSASWHILPFVIIKEKLAHPMQEGQVLFISPYIWYLVQCSVVISCGTCPCVKKLLKSFFVIIVYLMYILRVVPFNTVIIRFMSLLLYYISGEVNFMDWSTTWPVIHLVQIIFLSF